ncbi:cylicin-1 [Arvicanthis niloticus]|uniref:cylicin-1 n=1 Tax=Arvicanthis niloticus TaxID=61156 RepID=UPI00402B1697
MSLSKLREISTTTNDNDILISQTRGKWNQEQFALTFPKIPKPDIKKRSGLSELEVAVPRQDKKKTEEGQKQTHVWISQFLREVFIKSSFPLVFITQAPFKYLYNPQNHYIMAETRKPKDDKSRKTLKKNFREKLSSCIVNLESMRTRTNGKPEILGNSEKNPSKSSHKSKLPKKSISLSETNLQSKNSKKLLEMSLRNDNKNSMNIIRKEINNTATCCKDSPNTDSKKSIEEHSDEISECIHSSNMDLMLCLNDFRAESTDFDEWLTNCSQNNAKKPSKKGGKKERDSDIDSGDSKDAKKEGKKKDKKESKKKKDTSTDAEYCDSKDAKKGTKKDKKTGSKKMKDTDSTGGESEESKVSKKDKKEKKSTGKKGTESSGSGSVDSKGTKKVMKQVKKDVTKNAFSTDSESDAGPKKAKKNEKKENKVRRTTPIKDTESTDADSESEGDSTGKKGGKKDKKITKKGEKKDAKNNAGSSGSESDFGVKKENKYKVKDTVSYTDSASDSSSRTGRRKFLRLSDTESEDSSEFRLTKTTDDSDVSSTDSKRGMKRGFRTLSKKTTFNERGKRSLTGRIPSSRERLPFPPCEPFRGSPKPRHVCHCKTPPPPPKARYAPLPGVEWIHKLL